MPASGTEATSSTVRVSDVEPKSTVAKTAGTGAAGGWRRP